jgi:hypothetical protein
MKAVLGVLLALAVMSPAVALAQSRPDYVAQADTLCGNEPAASREIALIVAPTGRKKSDMHLLKGMVRVLSPVNRAYGRLTSALGRIPPGPGDESLAAQWIATRVRVHREGSGAIRAARRDHFATFLSRIRRQQIAKTMAGSAMAAFGPPSPFTVCTP